MEPTNVHTSFSAAITRILAEPERVRLSLQPIIDLQRGVVVGHEVLSRFDSPPLATPDIWFAAAERFGVGARLSAIMVERSMAMLPRLPANTFLTINLEPGHVSQTVVRDAFATAPRLDRIVIELTEHAVIDDPAAMSRELQTLKNLGARTAIDDAGAGYAGLQALLDIRPDIIKLDRALVTNIDDDAAKRALVRAIGDLADSIDAWVLAEGIESVAELEELVGLHVPLGQGYLLGRPAPGFSSELPASLVESIHRRITVDQVGDALAPLVERIPTRIESDPTAGRAIIVDRHGRPQAVEIRDGVRVPAALIAKLSEPVGGVARRCISRQDGRWSEPIVVTDGRGRAIGIVRVERLLEVLAGRPAG